MIRDNHEAHDQRPIYTPMNSPPFHIVKESNQSYISQKAITAMDAPVEQKVNATYFKCSSTQVTCCEQTEANFHLYLHQISGNPSPNQTVPVNPPNKNGFGMIVVNDWTIHEGRDPSSKVIARAQGMHAQSGQNKAQWYTTFNMVFEDDRYVIYVSIIRPIYIINMFT